MVYRVVKKSWQYVQPFWYSISVWRTDGRTDRQTDRQTDVQPISITCFSIADARKKLEKNRYQWHQNRVQFSLKVVRWNCHAVGHKQSGTIVTGLYDCRSMRQHDRSTTIVLTPLLVWLCFQKRLLIFPMGEKVEMCQYVWGENVHQVLDNSTTRLGLQKPAKFLFTIDGKLVRHVSQSTCAQSYILDRDVL